MFAPDLRLEEALRFSRFDVEHPLNTSVCAIQLDEETWPSAEHYVHGMLAAQLRWAMKIRQAPTALAAYNMAKPWYRPKKRGWKNLRRVYMTRALYTQVQMYPEVREFLLGTADELLVESSMYDHYWGIGRDQRGENMTGKVWMDIRAKLRRDTAQEDETGGSGTVTKREAS